MALLVDLDRVDAAEAALVAVLADGLGEGAAQALHAAGEDVGEAHEQRRAQAALLQVLHEIEQVDARTVLAARAHLDVPLVVDREEAGAPRGDVVQLQTVANGPSSHDPSSCLRAHVVARHLSARAPHRNS